MIFALSFRCSISSAVDSALVCVYSDATGANKYPWCSSTVYLFAYSHTPPSDLDGVGNDLIESYASQLLFSDHARHFQSPHILRVLTASTADGVIFIYSGSGSSVMRRPCRHICDDTAIEQAPAQLGYVMTVVTVMSTYLSVSVAGAVLCAPDAPDSMESWVIDSFPKTPRLTDLQLARVTDCSASGSTRTAATVAGSGLTVITDDDTRTVSDAHDTHSITCSKLGSQHSLSVSPSMGGCWHGTPWQPTAWWIYRRLPEVATSHLHLPEVVVLHRHPTRVVTPHMRVSTVST